MALKTFKPYTKSTRGTILVDRAGLWKGKPFKTLVSPKNAMTFADLSNIQSTKDLINEIIDYSIKNPHFLNQIAWLHASKAISQKWPCIIN